VTPDPESRVLAEERCAIVRSVLARLSTRDRDVLRAVFLEEKEKDEVCAQLGVGRDYLRGCCIAPSRNSGLATRRRPPAREALARSALRPPRSRSEDSHDHQQALETEAVEQYLLGSSIPRSATHSRITSLLRGMRGRRAPGSAVSRRRQGASGRGAGVSASGGAPGLTRRAWRGWFWPVPAGALAACAALLVDGGVPGRRGPAAAQARSSACGLDSGSAVDVLSVSRAAPQVVTVSKAQRQIGLTLSRSAAAPFTHYRCTLAQADGRAVLSAVLAAPAAGEELQLLLPLARLAPADYVLMVAGMASETADATDPQSPSTTSHFDIGKEHCDVDTTAVRTSHFLVQPDHHRRYRLRHRGMLHLYQEPAGTAAQREEAVLLQCRRIRCGRHPHRHSGPRSPGRAAAGAGSDAAAACGRQGRRQDREGLPDGPVDTPEAKWVIGIDSAETSVTGQQVDGCYVTTATSKIDGLNVLGRLKAKQIETTFVTRRCLEDGRGARFRTLSADFTGLTIDGVEIKPVRMASFGEELSASELIAKPTTDRGPLFDLAGAPDAIESALARRPPNRRCGPCWAIGSCWHRSSVPWAKTKPYWLRWQRRIRTRTRGVPSFYREMGYTSRTSARSISVGP